MKTITAQDVLNDDWQIYLCPEDPFCVYVIRDGDTILYIGKARSVGDRLLAHFGKSWRGSNSGFGPFYAEHQDKQDDWQIDLYGLRDCQPIVMQHLPVSEEEYLDPGQLTGR